MPPSAPDTDILIDIRCLQDPDYAERGIGRHALAMLRGARSGSHLPPARLIGLADPALPPPGGAVRSLLDAMRHTAYTGRLQRPSWFVSLSPMTHAPLFTGRLLAHRDTLKAAAIYDFIPLDFADVYLADPRARADYEIRLRWLERYDLFLPISKASAARLGQVLGARAGGQATVTGAALDRGFAAGSRSGARAHLLVVGVADPRKNAECAIRAHARTAKLQEAGLPVLVTGDLSPAFQERLARLATECGGQAGLLRFPGHIGQEELVRLYQDALCLVCPSRAEGFSLPVVEGMAAGVPVLASRIPAHEELVADPACLFDPEDDATLAQALDRLAGDPDAAAAIIAAQDQVWPRFREEAVAARFWQAIAARAAARPLRAPAALRGLRPRLALLSPVLPDRTGVAVYTAATCPALARHAELHVFAPTPSPAPLPGAASVQPLSALPHLSDRFDRVIGVLGNSEFHFGIMRHLLRFGGAALAHDARMADFYYTLSGPERAARQATAELRRPVPAAELELWLRQPWQLGTLFLGEVVQVAEPLIVHSRRTAELVMERYGIAPTWLPFCTQLGWEPDQLSPAARAAARARLGLGADEIVIASFGYVSAAKAPEDCIWALDLLRSWGYPARLQFVGSSEYADASSIGQVLEAAGLEEHVGFTRGFVDEMAFRDWLLAADLALQLRTLGFGSNSGALMDCAVAGMPAVANQDLAAAIDAPDYVRTVPDLLSPVLIAEALAELIEAGLHQQRPEAARRAYAEAHDFAVYAERLCAALELPAA